MSNNTSSQENAMAAVHAIAPMQDSRLTTLLQLHRLHQEALGTANNAVLAAEWARAAARRSYADTQVRIEILKQELGLCKSFWCYAAVEESDTRCPECERAYSDEGEGI